MKGWWFGLLVLCATALVTIPLGCSKRKEPPSGGVVGETPPPPPGKPVGQNDPRVNAAVAKLAEWVAMWRAADPTFRPESLYFAGARAAFRDGYIQPIRDFDAPSAEEAPTMEALAADSPDRRYKLVFDHYQEITEDHGDIDISGEPDSAPLLLDRKRGISNRFEFCGTPCGFFWGAWLSPTSFVLAGWQEAEPTSHWTRGQVTIYSIPDSTSATYVTRATSSAGFEHYREAWVHWVTPRYRAFQAKHMPS